MFQSKTAGESDSEREDMELSEISKVLEKHDPSYNRCVHARVVLKVCTVYIFIHMYVHMHCMYMYNYRAIVFPSSYVYRSSNGASGDLSSYYQLSLGVERLRYREKN